MLRSILYSIDSNTMFLVLLFIIFFVIINFALRKPFRKNRATSAVISFCISAMAVYGLNRTDFDISSWFYGIGFSESFLYTIVPLLALGFLILLSIKKDRATGERKFVFYRILLVSGIILIILSLAQLIYQTSVVLIIGIVLFIFGLILYFKRKGKGSRSRSTTSPKSNNNEKDYYKKLKALRREQEYEYYKKLGKKRKEKERKQRRDLERAKRRGDIPYEEKVKQRFIKRYGKRAWEKRERKGMNF